MDIVIASRNLHKIRELRELLKPFKRIDVFSLLNFNDYAASSESGFSFQENATLKAAHVATALQKMVIADDSGLVVPALGGAPGISSSHYAGDQATDGENRQKLLHAMKGLTGLDRAAYYECSLAIADPAKLIKCSTGICEGLILTEERGRNGFSYDSLFIKNDYDKTFGEIEETTKIRISHRRKAFEKLLTTLETLFI
jgi:XTP/dITP diphosphohydrolase